MPEQESQNIALYVGCPECVSFSSVESRERGSEIASSHNASSHDNEAVASTINVRDEDALNTFVQAVKERAPGDEYRNFIRRLSKGNAAFFCSARMYRAAVPDEDWYV